MALAAECDEGLKLVRRVESSPRAGGLAGAGRPLEQHGAGAVGGVVRARPPAQQAKVQKALTGL